jgi:hypothetical protein
MCEFYIPLQAPRQPYDPIKPMQYNPKPPPVQVFLNDEEINQLIAMFPQDREFEQQRRKKRAELAVQQILSNIKNTFKHYNYITNHAKQNGKP